MYVPLPFVLDDKAVIEDLLRSHDFALVVTAPAGLPARASHLPLLYDTTQGDKGRLIGHMARANPQWQDFDTMAASGTEALTIFHGVHGYISPQWYDGGQNVPTWNYMAVHLYGQPKIIEDSDRVRALLDELVARQEVDQATPWSLESQSSDYIARMMRGIVAFEIPVARIEAKAKLSQNKSEADQLGVITALETSPAANDHDLARVMRQRLGKEPI